MARSDHRDQLFDVVDLGFGELRRESEVHGKGGWRKEGFIIDCLQLAEPTQAFQQG